jgi:hypothetical protein
LFAYNPDTSKLRLSIAKCDLRDNYVKQTGLKLAEERMLTPDDRFCFEVAVQSLYMRDVFDAWSRYTHFPTGNPLEPSILAFVERKASQFTKANCNKHRVVGYVNRS